jgi:hypothetical protein
LSKYENLKIYLDNNDFEYVNAVGLNLTHIISEEPTLDLEQPILQQRRYAIFHSTACKPLITRIPIVWGTGFHACDHPIRIDPNLFMLHIKCMDYDLALAKQKLTREMKWAESSLSAGHGAHARYEDERFVREFFLDPNNLVMHRAHDLAEFEFSKEVERIVSETVEQGGLYWGPHFASKVVELPARLRNAF